LGKLAAEAASRKEAAGLVATAPYRWEHLLAGFDAMKSHEQPLREDRSSYY
jgi:hypothetical protein